MDLIKTWGRRNSYTLLQAAYLWFDQPPRSDDETPPEYVKDQFWELFKHFYAKALLSDLEGLEKMPKTIEEANVLRVLAADLKGYAESNGVRPLALFPEDGQPTPEGLDDKLLSDTEKRNLLKQIAALAMLLAAKRADFRVGDKPNRKQIAAAVAELLDAVEAGEGGELDRFGLSQTEFRRNISEGLALLSSK